MSRKGQNNAYASATLNMGGSKCWLRGRASCGLRTAHQLSVRFAGLPELRAEQIAVHFSKSLHTSDARLDEKQALGRALFLCLQLSFVCNSEQTSIPVDQFLAFYNLLLSN